MDNVLFSIIIPQRGSTATLPRLLDSIPDMPFVEVIIIDNSEIPIKKEDIATNHNFTLLWAAPQRFAGGARNVGLKHAHGEWVIFADADDLFAEEAFDVFSKYRYSSADIVYFSSQGIYADTGLPSDRGVKYTNRVKKFLENRKDDLEIRLHFSVPWSKMIRRQLIEDYNIAFDEIPASNDMYFSMKAGFYANEIDACDKVVYIVTTSRGSLTRRRDLLVIESRYGAYLRMNKFLRDHSLSHAQSSVMFYIYNSLRFGPSVFFRFLIDAVRMRQNIFVGCSRWINSFLKIRARDKNEASYIVK